MRLQAVGDLAVDLLGAGARPQGADHHVTDGEVRVFALTELEVGKRAADGDEQEEEQRQLAVAQRPGREIETIGEPVARFLITGTHGSVSASFTTCPGTSRLAPALTTMSPARRPEVMIT